MSTTIPLNDLQSARFDSAGETDTYMVQLQAGTTYQLRTDWRNLGTDSTKWPAITVTDFVLGIQIPVIAPAGVPTYTFTVPDTRYYEVSLSSPLAGAYDFAIIPSRDDYGTDTGSAGTLAIGRPASGIWEKGSDADWFAIAMQAGSTTWFSVDSATANNGVSAERMTLLDQSGAKLATMDDLTYGLSSPSVLSYTAKESATYYLSVANYHGYAGSYKITAAAGLQDDHADSDTGATVLPIGQAAAGQVETANDRDTFKFSVTADTSYAVELTQQEAGMSGLDISTVSYITWESKPGMAAYGYFTAFQTQDVSLTVRSAYGQAPLHYTVKVSAPQDDYAADAKTSGVLQPGGSARGTLDYAGDRDWFKVTLEAGKKYKFTALAGSNGDRMLPTPDMRMHDSKGNMVSSTSNFYNNTFTCTTSGDYYLEFGGSLFNNERTGAYTLRAFDISSDKAAPKVVSFNPADGAHNVALFPSITVTFDEAIYSGQAVVLKTSAGSEVERFIPGFSARLTETSATFTPSSHLLPGESYVLELPAGSVIDMAGNQFAGTAAYNFFTLPISLAGTDANDYLTGTGSGAALNGGAGTDTAFYKNSSYRYAVVRDKGAVRITHTGEPGQGDTLAGVERLMFPDKDIAVDIDGAGGQAYRLYQAAFNRTPDKAGVGYWMTQLDRGVTLRDVAASFLNSDEFKALYGTTSSDLQFVQNLYQNVLHRAPDEAGQAYWAGTLKNGAARADLLAFFSEGAENQAAVLEVIGNGFEYSLYG